MAGDGATSSGGLSVRVPGARVSLALLLLINLFNYIDRQVLAAVQPLIAKDLLVPGDPDEKTKMGSLATAFMVSYMLTAPMFGRLGDRMNRWWLIGIGVVLWTIASGASGLSHPIGGALKAASIGWLTGYGVLLLTRCFVGVGEGAYGPVAPSIISDMYPVARRGAVLAWFYAAIPVGSALGYMLGGAIGPKYGWPMAFYAVVPPGLLLGAWCFFRREPKRGAMEGKAANDHKVDRTVIKTLLRNKSYVLDVLGMTTMTFAFGGVGYWMPQYVAERLVQEGIVIGETPDAALKLGLDQANTRFGAILVVVGLLATLTGGWVGDKLRGRVKGSYFIVSGVGMLVGFPLFLGLLFTPFPYCWGVIAAAIFCLFFNTGPTNTIIANVTPAAIRSTAFALCILVIHALGDAISPTVIGYVADRAHSLRAGFVVVSVMMLLSGVFWLLGARHLERDTASASGGVK
jgi:MFS family permease